MAIAACIHKSVMTEEVINGLNIKANGIYIDATFGCGGHTKAVLSKLGKDGRIIIIDKDLAAIKIADQLKLQDPRIQVYHGSYAEILKFSKESGILGKVNGIILDLGVSSVQLDLAERGFSFMQDGPLDMRMDQSKGKSAAQWLETATEDEIANILFTYGEERYSKRLARAIYQAKLQQPITSTKVLAEIISSSYPKKYKLKKHPATRSFQAIRIFINNELADLTSALEQIIEILAANGRLVVISFHSLEDRIVKQFINKYCKCDNFPSKLPILAKDLQPVLQKIGKKQKPEFKEVTDNVRARSAILRIAEKIEWLGGSNAA